MTVWEGLGFRERVSLSVRLCVRLDVRVLVAVSEGDDDTVSELDGVCEVDPDVDAVMEDETEGHTGNAEATGAGSDVELIVTEVSNRPPVAAVSFGA